MYHFDFTQDPFSRVFLENEKRSLGERIALGLKAAARTMPIEFPPNCMLPTVDWMPADGACSYTYGLGIWYNEERYEALAAADPAHAEDIRLLRKLMGGYFTWDKVQRGEQTPNEIRLQNAMVCWGGTWGGHANPDYDRLLHLGTNGIRALIERCRAKNPGRDEFYDGCRIAMDVLDVLGDRVRAIAEENAPAETDAGKRAEWERIAETFRRVPREPAYDMYSAVMFFWLAFTFDSCDSPGRFDEYMLDYWRASSPEEDEELLTRFLEGIHNVRGWNLCISGSDENWNDETNELSYAVLRKVTELGYQTPNLTMRVHRNTPAKLWEMAAKCIGTGIGLPCIYNDEVVVPALEKIGVFPSDAHDYCMNGCNQIDIMGKSHMGLEDGEVNLARVLDLCLHGGMDLMADPPEMIVPRFGSAESCRSFEEFQALYDKYLYYAADEAVKMANEAQRGLALWAPNPYRSCLIQGCLEKGVDYKAGGPIYGHAQVLAEGIADAADSLWAIRTLVYEKKKYTMAELIDALKADWVGYEAMHRDFAGCEKFGNDLPELDELCAGLVDRFFRYLKTKKAFRGGVFTGGCSPFERAAENGEHTAALPNGKRKGESTFADSVAATPGRDRHGPTAAVKSMMHYDQTEACSGFVTQMKFGTKLFNSEPGRAAFIALCKTYFDGGGQQAAINVVDRETLLKARENPKNYANLIVRVGGYSDYFTRLDPGLQQNVIDRSEFSL